MVNGSQSQRQVSIFKELGGKQRGRVAAEISRSETLKYTVQRVAKERLKIVEVGGEVLCRAYIPHETLRPLCRASHKITHHPHWHPIILLLIF
jgi:hypothetical protein